MKNDKVRNHYIPKFIIKNFSEDNDRVNYFDKERNVFCKEYISRIFMENNLYAISDSENPKAIEEGFSNYEQEVAVLIKRFLTNDEIILTKEEEEKLKLFFALTGFRSTNAKSFFLGEESENIWKRNLEQIVKCRSVKEVVNSKEIDERIKAFMIRDVVGISGQYLICCERRGEESFILSDCYPTVVSANLTNGKSLPMYSIYPISPKRIIVMACVGIEKVPQHIRILDDKTIKMPSKTSDGKIIIHTKKIYNDVVNCFNEQMKENANIGYVY